MARKSDFLSENVGSNPASVINFIKRRSTMSTIIGNFGLDYPRTISGKQKIEALEKINEMGDKIIDQFFSNQEANAPTFHINNRLTRTYGRYFPGGNKIEMSGQFTKIALYLAKDEALFEKVLKHELAHWYLHKSGRKYGDGEPEFEKLLSYIGSLSSGSTNKKLQLAPTTPLLSFRVRSECDKCGASTFSNRRLNNRYTHSNCGGLLVDKELVVVKS